MKIYRLILILEKDFIRSLEGAAKTTTSEFKRMVLNSYKASQVYEMQEEDILIGSELTIENIKDRFAYYTELSQKKLGKLELLLCSSKSNLFSSFISLNKERMDKERLIELAQAFESDFLFEIKCFSSMQEVLLQEEGGSPLYNMSIQELHLEILKSYHPRKTKRTR